MTDAREQRIVSHLYLCRRLTGRYRRTTSDTHDLEQVAAVGLIKAADRFDEARGIPFEAFACRSIRGELAHYVRDVEHLVRAPRSMPELRGRLVHLAPVEDFSGLRDRRDEIGEAVDRIALAQLLARLPADEAIVLCMRVGLDIPTLEVAKLVGLSRSAIARMQNRALGRFDAVRAEVA